MKELYISPELEILCFAPVEALMDIGGLYGVYGDSARSTNSDGVISSTDEVPGDVTMPEESLPPT